MNVAAPAKINLTLDVFDKQPDGYHEIRSIMQTLALCDQLTIEQTPGTPGVTLSVVGPEATGVPADARNIVHKAAMRCQKIAAARHILPGDASGLHITLEKNIPSQAGLGGGSSDAAATLKAVNALFSLHLSPSRLTELAAALGADVPFFLTGGTARVEGLGERVTPLPPLPAPWFLVLVKPPVGISTAAAYAALGREFSLTPASPPLSRAAGEGPVTVPPITFREAFDAFTGPSPAARERGGEAGVRETLRNDFTPFALTHPAVAAAFNALRAMGGSPHLCGSGSAIWSQAENEQDAARVAQEIKEKNLGKVWVTTTTGASE